MSTHLSSAARSAVPTTHLAPADRPLTMRPRTARLSFGGAPRRRLMTTSRRLIHGRVDPEDHRQLQQEAAARRVSMTACVGDCLREYFALRTEMASAVTSPGTPGERHTGLIHSILARTEQRLVATLDA